MDVSAPPRWAKLSGAMELVVKVVAVGVPLLYATGRIYSDAYWGELRIPPSLLEYSAEDYLYSGFVAMATSLANAVGIQVYSKIGYLLAFALTTGAGIVAGSLVGKFIGRRIGARIRGAEQSVKQARDAIPGEALRHLNVFGAITSGVLAVLLGALGLTLLVLLPIALVAKAGEQEAVRERDYQQSNMEIYSHGVPPRARMRAHYRTEGVIQKARLVECGHSWCVVHEKGGFAAIPAGDVVRVDQESRAPQLGFQRRVVPVASSSTASGEARDQSTQQATEPHGH